MVPAARPPSRANPSPVFLHLMADRADLSELFNQLLEHALGYPEAWEDHPWGETVAKVRKKVFVFFGAPGDEPRLHVTVKLPEAGPFVLTQPWAEPTGYGLGKAGWVSIGIGVDTADPPDALHLMDLIDESYRTVAPKSLVAILDSEPAD